MRMLCWTKCRRTGSFVKRLEAVAIGEDFFGSVPLERDADDIAFRLDADDQARAKLRMRDFAPNSKAGRCAGVFCDAGKGNDFLAQFGIRARDCCWT